MKVLIVSGIWPPDIGGPASHGPQIARFLQARGHDVSAVVSAGDGLVDPGFAVRVISRHRPLALRMAAGTTTLAHAVRQVDVVYATGLYHRTAAACRLAGTPLVMKVVSDPAYERARLWGRTSVSLADFQEDGSRDPVVLALRRMRDLALGCADALIVPSEYQAQIVRGWRLRPPVSVIANPAVVAPSSRSREDLRSAYGMDSLTAVFAGRLVMAKNLPLAIDVMRDVDGLRLLIVGDGPERAALTRAVSAAGLGDRVEILPAVSQQEAGEMMRAADVTLLPSDWENFPHAVVESLAHGTPVIATAVGGVPEIVEHDRSGWLVAAGDRAALLAALLRFVEDGEARGRLRAGAAGAGGRYRPERLFAMAEELLAQSAAGTPRRRRSPGRAPMPATNVAARMAGPADRLRGLPVAGRALKALRGPADAALMALDRPPFRATVDGRVLAGFLRHRGYVSTLAADYEDYARQLFAEALRPGTIVVDGGAHIGLYTLTAALRIGASGRVHAFDADPYNLRALRLNVRRNGLTNVEIVARALSDEVGESTYYTSSGTIASSLVDKGYVDDAEQIAVQTTTIDASLAPDIAHIVVKLDVEGAEERVLRGARRTLAACSTGHALVEHNPSALSDAGSSGSSVLGVLRELGFTPYFIDERHRALVPIEGTQAPSQKGNLWATKGV